MKIYKTKIKDLLIIKQKNNIDKRGSLRETYNKKFFNTFEEESNKVSILAYDALGLIYYCWINNNFQFKEEQLYNKKGFKGLHAEFFIEDNLSHQKLKIYVQTMIKLERKFKQLGKKLFSIWGNQKNMVQNIYLN